MNTVPYPKTLPAEYLATIHDTKPTDKIYTVGAKLSCDFHFGGKPKAVCIEVVEEGCGRCSSPGKLRVRLTETVGAYKKDEILEIDTFHAVPLPQLFTKGYFGHVHTNYHWKKPDDNPTTVPA